MPLPDTVLAAHDRWAIARQARLAAVRDTAIPIARRYRDNALAYARETGRPVVDYVSESLSGFARAELPGIEDLFGEDSDGVAAAIESTLAAAGAWFAGPALTFAAVFVAFTDLFEELGLWDWFEDLYGLGRAGQTEFAYGAARVHIVEQARAAHFDAAARTRILEELDGLNVWYAETYAATWEHVHDQGDVWDDFATVLSLGLVESRADRADAAARAAIGDDYFALLDDLVAGTVLFGASPEPERTAVQLTDSFQSLTRDAMRAPAPASATGLAIEGAFTAFGLFGARGAGVLRITRVAIGRGDWTFGDRTGHWAIGVNDSGQEVIEGHSLDGYFEGVVTYNPPGEGEVHGRTYFRGVSMWEPVDQTGLRPTGRYRYQANWVAGSGAAALTLRPGEFSRRPRGGQSKKARWREGQGSRDSANGATERERPSGAGLSGLLAGIPAPLKAAIAWWFLR